MDKLPNETIVNAYQWYYLEEITGEEGSTNKPIPGATSISLKVPIEAAGKPFCGSNYDRK